MHRRHALLLLAGTAALSACGAPPPTTGADGRPLPRLYRISSADARRVPFRALDAVNALRAGAGLSQLQLDDRLTAAAATHSRDMSLQNRPWLFGSDGSSPIDRARQAGYGGTLLGEIISESYESELETVAAWAADPDTRPVLFERSATDMGFAFFQERNGKLWWTLNVGAGTGAIS